MSTINIYVIPYNDNISTVKSNTHMPMDILYTIGALALRNSVSSFLWPTSITNIICNGSESNLLECQYSTTSSCNIQRGFAVCQGTYVLMIV